VQNQSVNLTSTLSLFSIAGTKATKKTPSNCIVQLLGVTAFFMALLPMHKWLEALFALNDAHHNNFHHAQPNF